MTLSHSVIPSLPRRKIYLLNPAFQLTLMGYFTGLAIIMTGVYFASLKLAFANMNQQIQKLNLPVDHPVFEILRNHETKVTVTLLMASLMMFCILLLGSLLLSHQIAGPIYRMRDHLLKVATNGKPSQALTFRKGDFFQELPEAVNRALER